MMPMPALSSASRSQAGQNNTVIYTSGSNSGGARDGVKGCSISAGQGINLCLPVELDSCVNGEILSCFSLTGSR